LKQGVGYRLTSGDYQILYKVDTDAKTVEVVAIGHRKDVYP
jgi:mRNA-degrading endonuclease RelE of RelBE toxin-antitoxin system